MIGGAINDCVAFARTVPEPSNTIIVGEMSGRLERLIPGTFTYLSASGTEHGWLMGTRVNGTPPAHDPGASGDERVFNTVSIRYSPNQEPFANQLFPGMGSNVGANNPLNSGHKLTLDGKPLPAGTKVIFMEPANGYTGFGITDESGAYRIEWRRSGTTYDGLPVGNYQVMLVPAGAVDIDEVSAEDMLAGGPKPVKPSVAIPPKLLRNTTSGLAYDVSEGENNIDIAAVSR